MRTTPANATGVFIEFKPRSIPLVFVSTPKAIAGKIKSMTQRAASQTVQGKRYVLGSKSFAAISAVEGLSLRPESEQRLERTERLSPAHRRAATIRAFAGR
jgi:hypothetical protein